jgi:penicillin-binding protein-related factor A (putative recombinase)
MTPESRIKNSICSWLRFNKVFFWVSDRVGIYDPRIGKFLANRNPYRIKGIADILGIYQGKFLAIEVKTEKGVLSPEQKIFLDNINKEGGIAFVARSIEDVKEALIFKRLM